MITVLDFAKEQYVFVKDARAVLIDYCETINSDDFIHENSSFGHDGSIKNLLVHIVNCYRRWIANVALKKDLLRLKYDDYKNMNEIIKLFTEVDGFVEEFFDVIKNPEEEIIFEKDINEKMAKPFKIFSHVITHEFHHKGQILSISRHLGYTPVDTDVLR